MANEEKTPRHGGCFRCGDKSQPVLTSRTIIGTDYKPVSVALCDPCAEKAT